MTPMTPTTFQSQIVAASVCAFTLVLPLAAGAHDLVLVPEPSGNLTVKFGHPSDWQPAGKERLVEIQSAGDGTASKSLASSLKGKGLNLEATRVGSPGKASLVTGRYDNGLWVSMPGPAGKDVYFNTTKAMLPEATSTMSAIKFAKALYAAPGDTTVYKREAKHLIELIPQKNPADVKAGGTLPVLVMFAGKPLANAGVEVTDSATKTAEGQEKFTTDALGVAQVPIRRRGLNVVSVDYDQANDGSLGPAMKALPVDKIAMIATYAFQVR